MRHTSQDDTFDFQQLRLKFELLPYTHVASPCRCSTYRPVHYSVTRLLRRAVGFRTPQDLHENICAVRATNCTLATHGKGGSLEYILGARYLGWLWRLGGVRRKDFVVQIASECQIAAVFLRSVQVSSFLCQFRRLSKLEQKIH